MKVVGGTVLIIGIVLISTSIHAQSTPSLNLEGTGGLGPGPGACAPVGCSALFSATLSGQLSQPVSSADLEMNLQVGIPFSCICAPTAGFPCPAASILCRPPGPVPSPVPTATSSVSPKSGGKRPTIEAQILALQQQTESLQQQIDSLKPGSIGFPFPPTPGCLPATGSGTFSGASYSVNFTGQICTDDANNLALSGPISIVQSPMVVGPETWAGGTLVASGGIHIPSPTAGNPIPVSAPMVVSIVGTVGNIPGLTP
jgi:hypothetical protein